MIRIRALTCFVVALAPLSVAQAEEEPSWLARIELQRHAALMQKVGEGPAPFTTDGCSGGLSWTWRRAVATFPDLAPAKGENPAWEQCCITHDRAYHNASGTKEAGESYAARLTADLDLQVCVAALGQGPETLFYDQLGQVMFHAVRFGGGPCSGLSWRWGYGFADC